MSEAAKPRVGDLRLVESTDGRFRIQRYQRDPFIGLLRDWWTLGPSRYELTSYGTEDAAQAALDRIVAGPRVIRTVRP